MFEKLNKDIKICKENIILKEVLERKIVSLEVTLEIEKLDLARLKESLDKEYKDVKKLENISINNIFATLAGNKEDKLYKEQQEYIQVKLQYEECEWTVRGYIDNLMDMKVRILDLGKYDEEYRILISQKSELIKSLEIEDSIKNELEKEENNRNCKIKVEIELKEAIAACCECSEIIKAAIKSLKSAKNWGTFDLFGSNDMMSSIIKHQRINEAKMQLNNLGYSISRLNKELGDINMFFMFDGLNFDDLTYVFDVFFDNVFTDISVQNKIKDALGKVNLLFNKVENLLNELTNTKNQINEEIIVFTEKINDLIQGVE